eukprot:278782-Chlamydomonas_euryale.AAC.8
MQALRHHSLCLVSSAHQVWSRQRARQGLKGAEVRVHRPDPAATTATAGLADGGGAVAAPGDCGRPAADAAVRPAPRCPRGPAPPPHPSAVAVAAAAAALRWRARSQCFQTLQWQMGSGCAPHRRRRLTWRHRASAGSCPEAACPPATTATCPSARPA